MNATTYITIRRGSQGEAVKWLQKLLVSLGLLPGSAVDSVFGASTENAVKVFQARKGLSADGIVGPKTWKALDPNYTSSVADAWMKGATTTTTIDNAPGKVTMGDDGQLVEPLELPLVGAPTGRKALVAGVILAAVGAGLWYFMGVKGRRAKLRRNGNGNDGSGYGGYGRHTLSSRDLDALCRDRQAYLNAEDLEDDPVAQHYEAQHRRRMVAEYEFEQSQDRLRMKARAR